MKNKCASENRELVATVIPANAGALGLMTSALNPFPVF